MHAQFHVPDVVGGKLFDKLILLRSYSVPANGDPSAFQAFFSISSVDWKIVRQICCKIKIEMLAWCHRHFDQPSLGKFSENGRI